MNPTKQVLSIGIHEKETESSASYWNLLFLTQGALTNARWLVANIIKLAQTGHTLAAAAFRRSNHLIFPQNYPGYKL